jgi:hypothetical protein
VIAFYTKFNWDHRKKKKKKPRKEPEEKSVVNPWLVNDLKKPVVSASPERLLQMQKSQALLQLNQNLQLIRFPGCFFCKLRQRNYLVSSDSS